jgi:23S rRNA (pseudouridine1915-N3)-methyltransferase
MAEEAGAISALMPKDAVTVVLDERGKAIDSQGFAKQLAVWRDESAADVVFIIGGADGLSPELRRRSKVAFAFGAATWPHQLVRIMLMEQIYRAATILAGHPYHRA